MSMDITAPIESVIARYLRESDLQRKEERRVDDNNYKKRPQKNKTPRVKVVCGTVFKSRLERNTPKVVQPFRLPFGRNRFFFFFF